MSSLLMAVVNLYSGTCYPQGPLCSRAETEKALRSSLSDLYPSLFGTSSNCLICYYLLLCFIYISKMSFLNVPYIKYANQVISLWDSPGISRNVCYMMIEAEWFWYYILNVSAICKTEISILSTSMFCVLPLYIHFKYTLHILAFITLVLIAVLLLRDHCNQHVLLLFLFYV